VIGLPARILAQRARIPVPEDVTVLIAERKFVSDTDPYAREMHSPVLSYYVEDDWMHACEKCIELLLRERNAHTLVIHSNDEAVIRQFALKKPVARLLVNTPATLGGMGATTNLFPAMTLGSGSAGYGITSDNVSPLDLIYTRKVGYGVRHMPPMDDDVPDKAMGCPETGTNAGDGKSISIQTLHQILAEVIQAMNDPAER